jgi:hypothetical protein
MNSTADFERMRNILIVAGLFGWVLVALLWVWPQKRRLLKKHGYHKTNDYFIRLAKSGDPDARKARFHTWILVGVGIAGGLVMVVTKGA